MGNRPDWDKLAKVDFLKECMTDPALTQQPMPLDQFQRSYCLVCGQRACSRARANTMIFTERVATWEDRLFRNVPRAADNDERYAQIRAKNFQNVEEAISVTSRPDTEPPVFQPPEAVVHFDTPASTEVPDSTVENAPEAPAVPPATQPAATVRHPGQPTLNNTPFQGGIVLPGKPVDKHEDKHVEPGATITFDDE